MIRNVRLTANNDGVNFGGDGFVSPDEGIQGLPRPPPVGPPDPCQWVLEEPQATPGAKAAQQSAATGQTDARSW